MSILDAATIARKTKVNADSAALLTVMPALSMGHSILSISEAIANTRYLTDRRLLNNLAGRVRQMTVSVLRRDSEIRVRASDEKEKTSLSLLSGLKYGARFIAMALRRGLLIAARGLTRFVLPAFRIVGGVLLRCLPLLFNPVTLSLGAGALLGYGAYQLYRRFSKQDGRSTLPSSAVPTPGYTPEVVPSTAPETELKGKLPLGIRNNNPGNLRFANQAGADPRSGSFAVFPNQALGLYHLARQMGLHYTRGRTTIRSLIQVWAPPNENNTEAYISSVAKQTGVGPDEAYDFQDTTVVKALMRAIIQHENGMMPYSDAQLTEAAQAAQKMLAPASGGFIMPTSGVISSNYGARNAPLRGASTQHKGIDIAAPEGTPVVAAHGGVVTFAGTQRGYGKVVDVKGAGYLTRYGHLKSIKVPVNAKVEAGDSIGEVGSTGVSSGPHLHFEIRKLTAKGPSEPLNPSEFGAGVRGDQVAMGTMLAKERADSDLVRRGSQVISLRS